MGFRISRTNKDGPKSGRECQKIQEIRMGKYRRAGRDNSRTNYT